MVTHPRTALLFVVAFAFASAAACGGKGKGGSTAPSDPSAGGEEDCEPGRCLQDVSARVEDRRPAARACYEEGQRRIPELQGRLIINFEIDKTGAVVDASQSAQDEQIMDEGVVSCVVDVVRSIKFTESAKGKTTRAFHRFEFNLPPK